MALGMMKNPTGLCSLPGGEGNNMGLDLSFQWVVEVFHWRLCGYLAVEKVTQQAKLGRLTKGYQKRK